MVQEEEAGPGPIGDVWGHSISRFYGSPQFWKASGKVQAKSRNRVTKNWWKLVKTGENWWNVLCLKVKRHTEGLSHVTASELDTCVASVREAGGDMNWVLLGQRPRTAFVISCHLVGRQ